MQQTFSGGMEKKRFLNTHTPYFNIYHYFITLKSELSNIKAQYLTPLPIPWPLFSSPIFVSSWDSFYLSFLWFPLLLPLIPFLTLIIPFLSKHNCFLSPPIAQWIPRIWWLLGKEEEMKRGTWMLGLIQEWTFSD